MRFWSAKEAVEIALFPTLGAVKYVVFNAYFSKFGCVDQGGNFYILRLVGFDSTVLAKGR